MNLDQVIRELDLTILTQPMDFSNVIPQGGYASDLLSCVMAGACHQGIWVTLQAHVNIVAVASLLDQVAVIITEGAMPEESTITLANSKGVTLLSTPLPTFSVNGKLWELGLRAEK
jgi:hypothetical protein